MAVEKYVGNQRGFIYVSCDSKDQMETSDKYLEPLAQDGISFCWDDVFDKKEDKNIAKSNAVLLFLTKDYVREEKLRRTVESAVDHDKPILSVYLEDVELDAGLSMQLESQQAMFLSRYKSDEEFIEELKKAAVFDKVEVTDQQKNKQKRRVFIAVAAALAAVLVLAIMIRPLISEKKEDALASFYSLSAEELESIEELRIVGTEILDVTKNDEAGGDHQTIWVSYADGDTSVISYDYNDAEMQADAGDISDLTIIGKMKNLRVLVLAGQQIEDITPILELENLEHLSLDCNPVSSLEGLEKLKNLDSLHINSTNVEEWPEGLHVREIDADNTGLRMIPDFGGLSEVSFTEAAGGEPLSDISNIDTASSYGCLKFHCDNFQTDQIVAGLKGIPTGRLDLYDLGDISSLQDLAGIETGSLKDLRLDGSSLASLEGIENFENLEYLSLNSCEQLTDLSAVNKLQNLRTLRISRDMEGMAAAVDDRIEIEYED